MTAHKSKGLEFPVVDSGRDDHGRDKARPRERNLRCAKPWMEELQKERQIAPLPPVVMGEFQQAWSQRLRAGRTFNPLPPETSKPQRRVTC
jgi:hypothetical protein